MTRLNQVNPGWILFQYIPTRVPPGSTNEGIQRPLKQRRPRTGAVQEWHTLYRVIYEHPKASRWGYTIIPSKQDRKKLVSEPSSLVGGPPPNTVAHSRNTYSTPLPHTHTHTHLYIRHILLQEYPPMRGAG